MLRGQLDPAVTARHKALLSQLGRHDRALEALARSVSHKGLGREVCGSDSRATLARVETAYALLGVDVGTYFRQRLRDRRPTD